jgi:hypothetical protein
MEKEPRGKDKSENSSLFSLFYVFSGDFFVYLLVEASALFPSAIL